MRLACLLALALMHPPAVAQAADVVRTPQGEAIDRAMTRMAAFGISGALYVAKDGQTIVQKGYGIARRSNGARVSADDPFLIGSLSKQFTAAGILALEADGRLRATDSLRRFFPEAPAAIGAVTLGQLMSHTSGLPYMTRRSLFETRPRDSVLSEALDLPLESPPGTRYSYSNPGYLLLGGVIERVSGQRFEDFMRTRVFARAGLTRTRCLEPSLADTADLLKIHSYSGDEDEGDVLHLRDMSKSVGVGSVVTTVADLGRWAEALETDRVLPAAQREELFGHHADVGSNAWYGYGWNVARSLRGTTLYFHGGDLGGWNAEMRIDRDAHFVIVFLSNVRPDGRGSRDAVMTPVTQLLTGTAVAELPDVRTPTPAECSALAGRYTFAGGGTLEARATPAGLELTAADSAGLARLAGADATPPDSLHLDARARAVAEGLARHQFDALRAAMSPSLPADGLIPVIDPLTAEAEQRLGAFVGVQAVGTVATGPATAVSYVRTRRERGSTLLRLGWVRGRVLSIDVRSQAVLPTMFLPAADPSWVHVDPFTARVTRIAFARDPKGGAPTLRIGDDTAFARRTR
jgi:CubicO group peptidase (beta-lactamase class C family)